VRVLWQELGDNWFEEAGLPGESPTSRGRHLHRPVDDEWGRSESIDPDNVGDIADEGAGHRG
jgi:hypothetical protein